MKKMLKVLITLFLLSLALAMDSVLFMLKKFRGTLYFPGG